MTRYCLALGFVCAAATSGASGLSFTLTPTAGGITPQALAGFQTAANLWSARLGDSVNVNLNVGFRSLGGSILGQAESFGATYDYTAVRNALTGDATSATDAMAVASLAAGSSYSFVTRDTLSGLANHTATSSVLNLNNANAKALGLLGANNTAADATIEFNSNFSFDFDQSDGITGGAYDFVGIAAHEIGHALGFVSGVDDLDYYAYYSYYFGYKPDSFYDASHTSLDLFRYEGAGIRSFTTGNAPNKYFSLDGGATQGPLFSTGSYLGDGRQASHWKDNLGIGIMDPTADHNELLSISENDLVAMDAIGWNRPQAVPEPASMTALGLGALAILRRRRAKTAI